MKKELFKAAVLHQFKQEEAPIWILALQPRASLCMGNSHYKDKAQYSFHEFKLNILIEKISSESDRPIQWNVRFDDFEDEPSSTSPRYPQLDAAANPKVFENRYYCETVEFKDHHIVFHIKVFALQMNPKDYTFQMVHLWTERSLTYNVNQHRFANENEFEAFIQLADTHRGYPSRPYLDFLPSEAFVRDLSAFLKVQTIPLDRQKSIYYAFMDIHLGGVKSSLTRIIEDINDIQTFL